MDEQTDKKNETASTEMEPVGSIGETDAGVYLVELENFCGPMDLLLHLIRKHELEIFDIPIASITEEYLGYIETMQLLNLDVAGDFLVMAATLAHIKSKMLLPPEENDEDEDQEEEIDPREELVRRLLEYQKYRNAADTLAGRPMLGRDVFAKPPSKELTSEKEEVELEEVGVFTLIEIFRDLLSKASRPGIHQVQTQPVSVEEKIAEIRNILRKKRSFTLAEACSQNHTRSEVVAVFLAFLELTRLKVLRIYQNVENRNEIYLTLRDDAPSDSELDRLLENMGSSQVSMEFTE